jgi:hypothetical protein
VQRFITVLMSFERLKPRQYPSAPDVAPRVSNVFDSEIEISLVGMFSAVNFSNNVEMIVGALDASGRQRSCGPGSADEMSLYRRR